MAENETTKEKILDSILKELNLEAVVDAAIFSALTKEAKDKLVEGILKYLSSSSGSFTSKTVIQDAFEQALRQPIYKKMSEIIEADPQVMDEITKCVTEATKRFISLDKEGLIQTLANTMSSALSKDRY